jgi:di/tricarboxylate transporter
MAEERIDQQPAFDPLDMNNYRIEKLPKMQKSGFEKILQRIGAPLAILAFIAIYWLADIPFINRIDTNSETTTLTESAMKRYDQIAEMQLKEFKTPDGEQVKADELTEQQQVQLTDAAHDKFIRINYAMLAIFVAAIILWISEAIPNYLTSLLVILSIVLTGVTTDKTAYAQLGHPVMWLNILSFILASMLVKTQVAKRFALWFVLKFGKNAGGIMISFIVINLVLSAFISARSSCRRSWAASRFSLRYLAPFLFWFLLVRRARVSFTCLATSSSFTSSGRWLRLRALSFLPLLFLPLWLPP